MSIYQLVSTDELLRISSEINRELMRRNKETAGRDDYSDSKGYKFRNPDNPKEGWTGMGRQPNWLKEKLANGATLEDFRTPKD